MAVGIGFYGNSEANDGVYQLLYALDHANHTLTGVDSLVGPWARVPLSDPLCVPQSHICLFILGLGKAPGGDLQREGPRRPALPAEPSPVQPSPGGAGTC